MAYQKTTATKKILQAANSHSRIIVVQGGTSASKTISILLYLIAKAQSDDPIFPTLTSIVSESVPHLKRGAIRDFKNIMTEQGYWKDSCWNSTDSIYTFETRSQIEFFSSDNGDKLRGARRHRLFINEANNVPFDAFEQLEVRTKHKIFLDFNPTNQFWAFDLLNPTSNIYRPDATQLILTYKDNESLSDEIVQSIESRKQRKGWWKVYGEGQLGEVEGKIYKDWAIIQDIPHEAKLERIGVDFGYSNDPTAIVAVYRYNGGYILDELAYAKEMSNKQIADIIINNDAHNILTIADSAEPKSIAELAIHNITVLPAEKGRDSVANGIALVQDQRISMTQRSANLIREYRNYLWRTDKDGKILNVPEQGRDHAMDALRYALTSILRIGEPEERIEQQITNARSDRSYAQVDTGLSL